MANFRTHITVAAVGGALLAVGGWQAGCWSAPEALMMAILVAFGGILPDIDADNSYSIRLIFSVFSVLSLVLGVMVLETWLTPGLLLVACGSIFVGVRYLGAELFRRLTVHRGIWHSLMAGALCALVTAAFSFQLLGQPAWLAWCQAGAVLLGFLIHLSLDELFSVDLEGARLKRSFGTALKLAGGGRPISTLLMLMALVLIGYWVPPWGVLTSQLSQASLPWR